MTTPKPPADAETVAAAYAALGATEGPQVVRTVRELRETLGAEEMLPEEDRLPRAVVMTMGALHNGHAALMRAAREWTSLRYDVDPDDVQLVVTLFVNPTQFGPGEDFERYPRAFDDDIARCAREGVDVVFAPSVEQMYPAGATTVTVDPGPLGGELEGAIRPGHFRGMLTVVLKLLHLVRPDAAFFGEKDYQQLTLIRRMVRDLDLGVDVVGVPTVREPDGLAMSSRNAYLGEAGRADATALVLTLAAGQEAADDGHPAAVLERELATFLAARPGVESVDYVAVRDPDLGPPPTEGEARLLVAARVGGVRLIDNARVDLGGAPA